MVTWDVGTMSLEGAHFIYAVLATQHARSWLRFKHFK